MNTKRSTWWSVTAYNDEIVLMETKESWPDWVKTVYGGREECPTTKKLHFQGAIQLHSNCRMSQIKKWLPTAHLEPAISAECLKKYVMKAETAAGEKTIVENPKKFLKARDVMELLARQSDNPDIGFKVRRNMILTTQPDLCGMLMNPTLKKFWEDTQTVWLRAGHSITPAQSGICPGCEWAETNCDHCYLKAMNTTEVDEVPLTLPSQNDSTQSPTQNSSCADEGSDSG